MPMIEPVIRPPAEADSFLLQLTTGCSSNQCTFCGAYLGKPFRVKDSAEVEQDLRDGAADFPETRRVFLMDGDALAIGNERLIPLLKKVESAFPHLNRIASYANGHNITRRTPAELGQLTNHKLCLIYLGLETGSQLILDRCRKRSTVTEMIAAVRKAESVGIKSSVMVLLGLGGKAESKRHVEETITALNLMQPRYLSFLSVMLIPGTELFAAARRGEFTELTATELLNEAYQIIAGLELQRTVFRSNHVSNHLALEGRLPTDKAKLLQILEAALHGKVKLKPEFLRDL